MTGLYILEVIGIAMVIYSIYFLIKAHSGLDEYCRERDAKLDKEDKILHELTACRKD